MVSAERYYLAMAAEKLRRTRNAILYAVAGLRPAVIGCGLVLGFLNPASLLAQERESRAPRPFFDSVVSISPGISRELDLMFDHARLAAGQITDFSVRVQYPVSPWLQFSLEVPAIFQDPDAGPWSLGAGDIVLQGQAMVWTPSGRSAELDVGLELIVPSGGSSALAGSTAVRPFGAWGVKVGPLDVIGNLSYQWIVAGPVAGVDLFQATLAIGYPTRWVTPFAELTLVKPARGADDDRTQVAIAPGIEVFLPWRASLSVGVQLPLTSGRSFDQRVLAFFKLPF
jgi:hypothetical protein